MDVESCLIIVIILLCMAIISNFLMYYKCYLDNINDDPYVPDNVGTYKITIYYSKGENSSDEMDNITRRYVNPMRSDMLGRYVVVHDKPSFAEYKQIAAL